MLDGEKLDRLRDLAYRELEDAEDEEILAEAQGVIAMSGIGDVAHPVELVRERPRGVPVRAITSEFEIPLELRRFPA